MTVPIRIAVAVAVAVAVGALALAPSAATAGGPAQQETVPGEFTDPTPDLVADSIHVWDPSGHVHVWDVSGHVTGMETLTTEGAESILSLDSDILFAFGSAELPQAAGATIATLVADIPPSAAVSVTGHTDDVGSDADNLVLSQQRAQAVAGAISAARGDLVLQVDGRGETEPVESNAEPAGREANRRVEVRYQG